MTIRIGIAGWSIRREQADLFKPGPSHLARYATRFNAVEINSSFYRPHRRSTYERWAASVPGDFRFSAKLPRAITHQARLADPEAALDAFAGQVLGLGEKLGPLLAQLPPSLIFDAPRAGIFFQALRARFDGLLACEPRHASWFGKEADALLKRHHIARVAADPAPVPGAEQPGGWSGYRYFRWHGSPVMYRSAYAPARLQALAAVLKKTDWCIFDNTAEGAATADAFRLQGLL
jgi:uncharacterized protein YecE (DUF72 family)